MNDEAVMSRALRLSILGRHASPNPMVGCVIIGADGERVGEGFHERPGSPHAEIVALARAGNRAKGATAYVTLEPCSHHGRTPPCADALIASGLARVVAAVEDPDVRVRGTGLSKLVNAGIDVRVGVCEREARVINAAFFKHRLTGFPYVTVKMAMTLDGRIATGTGDSRWITSAITRKWVHRQLRDRTDAIVVGIGTVLADNPALTCRLDRRVGRSPRRIILDTSLRTPLDSRIVSVLGGAARTTIVCGPDASNERRERLEALGAVVKVAETTDDHHIDLKALMLEIGTNEGVQGVLVEGGAQVVACFVAAGLVDRYIAAIAPKLIGGRDSPGPIGGAGLSQTMDGAAGVANWKVRRSGPDLIVDGLLERGMV